MNTTTININEYLDEISKYSIYSLNDFVEVFNDPSILEGVDVRDILKRKKIVRKLFEMYLKEFLRDHNYDLSLPFYDNGVYWFNLEIIDTAVDKKQFRIIKSEKNNFIRDSIIVLTKLAEYFLYISGKKFTYGITSHKYDDSNIIRMKIESYPYNIESQAYLLKFMSFIRDLGTSIEYDF